MHSVFDEYRPEIIDWSKKCGAYGPVKEFSSRLTALASSDDESASKALAWMWENLIHQGTRFPAGSAAIPFLINLLDRQKLHCKSDLIWLVYGLVVDEVVPLLPDGFDPDKEFVLVKDQKLSPADEEAIFTSGDWETMEPRLKAIEQNVPEIAWRDCYAAVESASELFCRLTAHPDSEVRLASVCLLA